MVTKPQDGGKLEEKLVALVLHTAQLLFSSRSQLQHSFMQLFSNVCHSQAGQYTSTCLPQHSVCLEELQSAVC